MRPLLLGIASMLLLSGCAAPTSPTEASGAADEDGANGFHVPPLTVGDRLRYGFGFTAASFSATGIAEVTVIGVESHADGFGVKRPAVHVRQAAPGGGFAEDYWADPETYEQFHLQRGASYNQSTRFPTEPVEAVPQRHAMYANGTGVMDRYATDPVFEDLSFFGTFATDEDLPVEGSFQVEGDLWLRETTFLLKEGPWNGTVKSSESPTWGPLRQVEATAAERLSDDIYETMHWQGSFSEKAPMAVDMIRHIEYRIHGEPIKLSFNATLLDYTPGTGASLARGNGTDEGPQRPGVDRAAWQGLPPDGSGARVGFPLSEARAALDHDPTAIQYFTDHAGSYLKWGDLSETNTCGFYGGGQGTQDAPGCHWWTWEGRFDAPDDYSLLFVVEKYADASGTGVAYVPAATRDYVFESLFSVPDAPEVPPPAPVRVIKAPTDLPARTAFPSDTITIAGALSVFAATGTTTTAPLPANEVFLVLGSEGYGFEVARFDWYFPSNPELFMFYDDAPMAVERHTMSMTGAGWVEESRNFDATVEQR